MNESDLIRQCQQGDRAAFESLARSWARPIYAWLMPHVKDLHRCEDLTQDTLLRAWRSIRTLDDPAKFKGWIFSVANSVLIDQGRFNSRKRRDKSRTRLSAPLLEQAHAPDPIDIDPRQDEVLDALARLPETYRHVLSLRFLSGLSPGEIEKRLKITNGSLRGLLHRGLNMLRDELLPIEPDQTTLHGIKP